MHLILDIVKMVELEKMVLTVLYPLFQKKNLNLTFFGIQLHLSNLCLLNGAAHFPCAHCY